MSYSALLDSNREPSQLDDDDFEEEIFAKGVWRTLWNLQLAWKFRERDLLAQITRLQDANAHLNRRTSELAEQIANEQIPKRWRTSSKRD